MLRPGALLVIGSNPPSQTIGRRTLARVEQARVILGFSEVRLANFFSLPSYRSGGVSELGTTSKGLLDAGERAAEELDGSTGILLAYGTQPPAGLAREHFRGQVAWVKHRIGGLQLPCWWVGGAPRHPSRRQRFTWREFPEQPYADALERALVRCS